MIRARKFTAREGDQPCSSVQTDHCDFVLDPGQTVHIRLVDRAAQPVSGVDVLGESGEGRLRLSMGPAFDVVNLVPRERRKIEIYHRERQIGKHLDLNYDEKTPRTMTVTLEPCATVVGRLVDAEGVPIQGVEIHTSPTPGSWPWMFTPIVTSARMADSSAAVSIPDAITTLPLPFLAMETTSTFSFSAGGS